MKAGEKIKIEEEKVVIDPKWGEVDFTLMKEYCVVCNIWLKPSKKRFIASGNYCINCSAECGVNLNHKVITIKPNE